MAFLITDEFQTLLAVCMWELGNHFLTFYTMSVVVEIQSDQGVVGANLGLVSLTSAGRLCQCSCLDTLVSAAWKEAVSEFHEASAPSLPRAYAVL